METLFIFIAKSSGLVALFYAAYYFLLRKETFFNSNRWFLLAGLITSIILPLLVYTKTVWVDPTPISNLNLQPLLNQSLEQEAFEINWNYVILGVYAIGFLAFLIKFAMDFYSLNAVIKGKKVKQQADFKFIDINENIAPFSYFDYIVYNSSLYSATELESILEHEKVHSDQNHTIDVLISRVFCMLFWFNPIIWLYTKAISQNLEFIADSEAAKKLSDRKAYQYTLLKVTTHENCVAITNHFYQSLIKKRIIMLNKNQSKKKNSWKYCTVIPALVAFVLLFQVEVIAHEKQVEKAVSKEQIKAMDVYKIQKSTTDQELNSIVEKLKAIHNVDAVISEVKRNTANELTSIKIDLKKGTEITKAIQIAGSNPIKDCSIIVTTEEDGSKKINLLAANNDNSEVTVVETQKSRSSKTEKINTETNVKINDNTSKISNTTAAVNTNVDVNTNVNANVKTVVITTTDASAKTNGPTTLSISNTSPKAKLTEPKLIFIDGVKQPSSVTLDDLQPLDIKTMHVYKGVDALAKYGEEGKNGVIEIETRK